MNLLSELVFECNLITYIVKTRAFDSNQEANSLYSFECRLKHHLQPTV